MDQVSREVEPIESMTYVQADIDSVAYICDELSPESAWYYAVSGDTAKRMAGIGGPEWDHTAEVIAKAAAYGWWPQGIPGGRYVAVPIDKWVADGHPYTKIVPDLASLLDRWGVAPVVIDGAVESVGSELIRQLRGRK